MKLHITPSVYFVKSGKALVETLFQPKGTASGTFKIQKRGVLFMRPDGSPEAYLCANREHEEFFVSCSRRTDGKIWYMFSTMTSTEEFLGIHGMGFLEGRETARRVWLEAQALKPAKLQAP